MNEQDELYLQQQQIALEQANAQTSMPYSASAMMQGVQKQNLVEWELDFSADMMDIRRVLRCDVQAFDKDGNEFWMPNPDPSKVFLNELGINDVERIVRLILNKNTVLSWYREQDIRERVRWFGHELRALLYNNAEEYGIDNPYKENNYSMMVYVVLCMVDSAYRRAVNGETHKRLNEARIVQQHEPLGGGAPQGINIYPGVPQERRGSKLLPWNWFKK